MRKSSIRRPNKEKEVKMDTWKSFGEYTHHIYKETKGNMKQGDDDNSGFLIPDEPIDIPKNNWQWIKYLYFPSWFKKWFPVKYKTVDFVQELKRKAKVKT